MKQDKLSPELQGLLNDTPILTDQDVGELGDAIAALDFDPEFVADCMKGDFVNDILQEMSERGINKNQLAKMWGKSRQHVGKILDEEKAKNFTIDTIVSLSMTLGLKPQRIKLEPIGMEIKALSSVTREKVEVEALPDVNWCEKDDCVCALSFDSKNTDQQKMSFAA